MEDLNVTNDFNINVKLNSCVIILLKTICILGSAPEEEDEEEG